MDKLTKEYKRYLERELRDYEDNLKELEELKMDIIEASPKMDLGAPGSPNKGNEVQTNKVHKLISNKQIQRLEKMCKHIEKVLNGLDDIHYKFYIEHFKKGNRVVKVCMDLHIGEKTFYRYKNYIINSLAEELGYV